MVEALATSWKKRPARSLVQARTYVLSYFVLLREYESKYERYETRLHHLVPYFREAPIAEANTEVIRTSVSTAVLPRCVPTTHPRRMPARPLAFI